MVGLLVLTVACRADEAEAVKAMKKLTGTIQYDSKAPGKPVKSVNLSEAGVKDSDLKWMKEFKQRWKWKLRQLELWMVSYPVNVE